MADVSVTIDDTNRSFNNAVLYENAAVLMALGLATYTGPDADETFNSSGVGYDDIYACPSGSGCTFLTDAQFDDDSWMRTLDLPLFERWEARLDRRHQALSRSTTVSASSKVTAGRLRTGERRP